MYLFYLKQQKPKLKNNILQHTLTTKTKYSKGLTTRGCVKTLAQPLLYFKFCYIIFWLCCFFLMHLATSCYIPIISGYK